ncbi:MAG TPA: FadR/GntR family transcriptional regulator [Desulfomonilaceae bacterium]|nr:FadR/GntR family transcriptional regulator [Desulfomonilaceae bacterium]
MRTFRPIRPSRISEEVTEQIKQSILFGDFKAGDKLPPERLLAGEFQVSRVAVREALRHLEKSGFIETRQGATGGTFVTDLSFAHLADAFLDLLLAGKITIPELVGVRILIEPQMARLAATKVTPKYAKQLKEALASEKQVPQSLVEDLEIKTAVHFILAEMSGNGFFEALIRSLMGLTRRVVLDVQPDTGVVHPAGMHHPIVEAVLAGNEEAAYAAMKKHTIEFGQNFIKMERDFREKNLQF